MLWLQGLGTQIFDIIIIGHVHPVHDNYQEFH